MRIISLSVSGFRSLKNVKIDEFGTHVVLFGDNDSGKSNILAFLEVLFARKIRTELTEVSQSEEFPEGGKIEIGQTGFWQGQIQGFNNNFFRGQREPIEFDIALELEAGEIIETSDLNENFKLFLAEHNQITLRLQGEFRREDPDVAEMHLLRALLGEREFYDSQQSGIQRYAPGFEDIDETERENVFVKVMGKLDDAFLRIPPNRFLDDEMEIPRDTSGVVLVPASFKNWLFRASLSKDDERIFTQLRNDFSSEPFSNGDLSLARIDENGLELFVEDQWGLKLPIGRKGSGIQQILIILAYIAQARARFVGIEEIEINLSPSSIQSVMETLGGLLRDDVSEVNQLFLTTHSPRVASITDDTKRLFVMMNGQGETEVLPADDPLVNSFYWPEKKKE